MTFTQTSDGKIIAYTDGSYRNGIGGIGVYVGESSPHNISKRTSHPTRGSHCAEIQAVAEALTLICDNGYRKAMIYTDSEVVFDSTKRAASDSANWEKLDAARRRLNEVQYQIVDDSNSGLKAAHKLAYNAL
eukprot:TRINITY_DN1321_c0_g1_i1.p1 TRINITY_DN1321_c0_g1~~TRINITY_DN1321_c0_g1_i1.p1  ORF type:complete len:132 (-),score=10.79 TRINITY_DN1321_c0_g1_i1:109-504(-)